MDLSLEAVRQNIKFYNKIKPKNPKDTYTVLATVNDLKTGRLLALATGTQANNKQIPDDIEDCHAESLVKRAFKRYLIELIRLKIDSEVWSDGDYSRLVIPDELILFVSQFPCGFIKRYDGPEPTDPSTGHVIDRKPGRGTEVDGKVIYVKKQSCVKKVSRWIIDGLQGKKIADVFGFKCHIRMLLIGNCESGPELDYRSALDGLKKLISDSATDSDPRIIAGRHLDKNSADDAASRNPLIVAGCEIVEKTEFTFAAQRQAQPTSIVWWANPEEGLETSAPSRGDPTKPLRLASSEDDYQAKGHSELLEAGRKKGLTRKQLGRIPDCEKFKLKVGDSILRKDLREIEARLAKPKKQTEDGPHKI